MKIGLVITCLFIVGISTSAIATTLNLSPEIDLIVVDGQKVSSSLLKGADKLELDNGQHQILFKVIKTTKKSAGTAINYRSQALIAVFDTRNLASVSFKLPPLETEQDQKRFDHQANYQLVDERNQLIPTRSDIMLLTEDELENEIEKKMSVYNSTGQPAAVPDFAIPAPSVIPLENGPSAQIMLPYPDSETSFSAMQYWFQQADQETRQRFLRWIKEKDLH